MRHKLDRYVLSGLPGVTAPRMARMMQFLQAAVNPRVAAAVLRTLWNGWTTEHRFQGSGTCVLGCSSWAEDKVEHYAVCPCVKKFGRSFFNFRPGPDPNQTGQFITLGLNDGTATDEDIVRKALWVYATYRTVMDLARDDDKETQEAQDIQELTSNMLGKEFKDMGVPLLFWIPALRASLPKGTECSKTHLTTGRMIAKFCMSQVTYHTFLLSPGRGLACEPKAQLPFEWSRIVSDCASSLRGTLSLRPKTTLQHFLQDGRQLPIKAIILLKILKRSGHTHAGVGIHGFQKSGAADYVGWHGRAHLNNSKASFQNKQTTTTS